MALTLTKTQDEFVLCCCGNNLRSQKIVKQHLQAQQLDGGEGGGDLDAGVQAHTRCIGCAVEAWSACKGGKFGIFNANAAWLPGLVISVSPIIVQPWQSETFYF